MQAHQPWRALVLVCAIGLATPVAAQGPKWGTYMNARFGTTADYPVSLFTVREPPPDNSDGQIFRTADRRAELRIYGARNAEEDDPKGYVERHADLQGVTLKRITSRFFVLSGTRGDDIFYQRCNFSKNRDGIIDCVNLTYPAKEKTNWDPIVTRLGQSLRAGQGFEPR
jgi:hypothetical protein